MIGMSAPAILCCNMVSSHHTASSTSPKHSWIGVFFLLTWTSTKHWILVLLHLRLIIVLRPWVSCSNRVSHKLLLIWHLIIVTVGRRLSDNSRKQVSSALNLGLFKALVIRNRSILLIVLLMLLVPLLSRCGCPWLRRGSSNCCGVRNVRIVIWCSTAAILWEQVSNTLSSCSSQILHRLELLLLVVV